MRTALAICPSSHAQGYRSLFTGSKPGRLWSKLSIRYDCDFQTVPHADLSESDHFSHMTQTYFFLMQVRGKKILILDRKVSGFLGLIAEVPLLKEHGVER